MVAVGVSELLLLLLFAGGPFNQFLGLPPGERDPNLVHAAPADSLLYVEWSARGEGKPGAAGIDGLVADPEVVTFIDRLKSGIETAIARNTGVERIEVLKSVPDFVLSLTGKPGCLYWGLDPEAAGQGAPPQMAFAMAVRAGLVVNAGDEADDVADKIKSLIAAATGMQIGELDHAPLPLPAPVQIHRHEDYIILAVGPDAVDNIIKRLADKDGGISNHEGFAEGWQELRIDRSGLVTFVDIDSGIERIGSVTGAQPQINQGLQMAGLVGADWAMSVTGVADGQIVSRGRVNGVTGDQGLMALVSGRGIESADFALVPGDSDVVLAVSADVNKILDTYMSFFALVDPNSGAEVSQAYGMFSEYLGLDFERDVFAALDQVVTISNSPGDGGWIGSSPVLTIGIQDAARAAKASKQIAAVMEREFPHPDRGGFRRRGATLERRQFMETEILMVNIIGEGDVPIAPAWCLTDTHVMIALHPQPLKSRLRRLQSDDWKSFGQQFSGGPDGEAVFYSMIDVPNILPQIYGFLPWLGQTAMSEMQLAGVDVNLIDLPSAAAVLPYMNKSKSYLVRTPEGLSKHSEGPPVVGGVPSLVPTLFMSMMGIRSAPVVIQDVEAVEALEAEVLVE